MIGAYICDDFYLHFRSEDIEIINNKGYATGTFAVPSNSEPNKIIPMNFIVKVSATATDSDINIHYQTKVVVLVLTKNHFVEWLLVPDETMLRIGPSHRFATTNLYLSQDRSSKSWEKTIERTFL